MYIIVELGLAIIPILIAIFACLFIHDLQVELRSSRIGIGKRKKRFEKPDDKIGTEAVSAGYYLSVEYKRFVRMLLYGVIILGALLAFLFMLPCRETLLAFLYMLSGVGY